MGREKRLTEKSDGHLEEGRDDDGPLHLPHADLPQLRLVLVRHVGHQFLSRTLPLGQGQDGEGGHQKGKSAALDDGQADAHGALEERDDSRDEDDGRHEVRSNRVRLFDAQGRRQDERHGNGPAEHGQVVLRALFNFVVISISAAGGGAVDLFLQFAQQRRHLKK